MKAILGFLGRHCRQRPGACVQWGVLVAGLCLLLGVETLAQTDAKVRYQFSTSNTTREFGDWRASGLQSETGYQVYWVAFCKKLGRVWLRLDSLGVRYRGFQRRLPGAYLYIFDLGAKAEQALMVLKEDRSFVNALPLYPRERVSYNVWQQENLEECYLDRTHGIIRARVGFYEKHKGVQVYQALEGRVERVLAVQTSTPCGATVAAAPFQLRQLAESNMIEYVAEQQAAELLMPGSRKQMLVDSAQAFREPDSIQFPPLDTTWWSATGHGLSGTGVVIGVYDEGIDSLHPDFRVVTSASGDTVLRCYDTTSWFGPVTDHGTAVAGAAAGNGWMSGQDSSGAERYQFRGIAPGAALISRDVQVSGNYAGHEGDVNNHSHGGDAVYYGVWDHDYDEALSDHDTTSGTGENNVMVYAAGNSGGHVNGYYSMTINSKNAIKVGAADKYTTKKSEPSSAGPTFDGRIGPDLVVPVWAPYRFDGWTVELDYVRLVCDSDTVAWEFNSPSGAGACDSFGWGCSGEFFNLRAGGGGTTMAFETHDWAYHAPAHIYSDSMQFPPDTTARLVLRYRITDDSASSSLHKGEHRFGWMDLFWQGNTTAKPCPYWDSAGVRMLVHVNAGWQEATIPLAGAHQYAPKGTTQWYSDSLVWNSGMGSVRRLCLGFLPTHSVVPSLAGRTQDRIYKYQDACGTSLAAPQVVGVVALMLQKYRDSVLSVRGGNIHDDPFWNSTARAILVHTATDLVDTVKHHGSSTYNSDFARWSTDDTIEDLYTLGPDWATGYGLVDAAAALAHVDTTRFWEDTIGDRELRYYTIHVPAGTDTLRVTLGWDDAEAPASQTNAEKLARKLTNDLDLYLVGPADSGVYRPMRLLDSPFRPVSWYQQGGTWVDGQYVIGMCPDTLLANHATPGIDTLNNLEVAVVPAADTGMWTIVVEGRDVVENQSLSGSVYDPKQDFSLVYDLDVSQSVEGSDATGPLFRYASGGSPCTRVRATSIGRWQLAGAQQTGTLRGLRFGNAASLDSTGDLICGTLYEDQGSWLDNASNLAGGLVLRNPQGVVTTHVSTDGTVRVRSVVMEGYGSF